VWFAGASGGDGIFDFRFSIFDWELPLQMPAGAAAPNRKSRIENRKSLSG
jgi:hypothetical protein